jgi:YfiH family protein
MPVSIKSVGPTIQSDPDLAIQEIDAVFETAGLVRNLRPKAGGVTRRMRRAQLDLPDLRSAPPHSKTAANGVRLLRIQNWEKFDAPKSGWLWHGFSTRMGGVSGAYCTEGEAPELNLGFTVTDERQNVEQNRLLLAEAVTGDPTAPLITLRQVHSNVLIHAVAGDEGRANPRKADGVMTDDPGVLIGVQTADCVPVLVADRKRLVVAAFHAGWRGTVKRIVESGVGRMRMEFGSRPEDLIAAIGPCIGACCYAVGQEVVSSFESQFAYADVLFHEVDDADEVRRKYPMLFLTQRAPGHSPMGPNIHLDLVEANRRQLLDAGLGPKSIQKTGGCTSCHRKLFFSHRASQGDAGRMMSVIGIRPR